MGLVATKRRKLGERHRTETGRDICLSALCYELLRLLEELSRKNGESLSVNAERMIADGFRYNGFTIPTN